MREVVCGLRQLWSLVANGLTTLAKEDTIIAAVGRKKRISRDIAYFNQGSSKYFMTSNYIPKVMREVHIFFQIIILY